jgi:chromosome segregation ATPase
MSKRATSTTSPNDSASLTMDAHLPDSAQQQLAALRRTLESRLAALEEVLKDPSRGESLAGLILELSRVATEEAQLAASQACMAIKAGADEEIAALRASAKAALEAQAFLESGQTTLEQEQAVSADLRRELDHAKVENRKQAELLTARKQVEARLEAELVKQQAITADLQRTAGDLQRAVEDAQQQLTKERRSSADWQSKLETERAAGAQLKQSAEAAVARFTGLERALADERSAHEAAVADLAEARAARDAGAADLAQALAGRDAVAADLAQALAGRDAIAADLAQALAGRDAVAADLAREREGTADRERAQMQLQSQLEAERAMVADLRHAAEAVAAGLSALERDLADERSAHEAAVADLTDARAARDAVAADLARELQAAGDRGSGQAQLQSQLEAERATVAELRQAAARAEELRQTLARETSEGQEPGEEAALLQKSLAEAQKVLAQAQMELEAERTSKAELRQAAEYTDQQLASARSNEAQAVADHQKLLTQLHAMTSEREAITDELTAARKWINDLREAEAQFALPPAPPHLNAPPHADAPSHVDAPHAKSKAKAKGAAPAAVPDPREEGEPEEGWQAVRLAPRFLFADEISVQVNGDPARLFDISISGCQLLSPTALKPNQMVKVLLPAGKTPLACSGKVVWTRLEPMAAGQPLGYRAGVRFTKADEAGIEKFAARHATP